MEEGEEEEDKEHEKKSFAVFPGCYVEIHLFLLNLFFFVCFDVTRNGNNLKLKVKSEFSLSMGLMVINHSNPYIHSTTILCDYIIIIIFISVSRNTSCRKCSKMFLHVSKYPPLDVYNFNMLHVYIL